MSSSLSNGLIRVGDRQFQEIEEYSRHTRSSAMALTAVSWSMTADIFESIHHVQKAGIGTFTAHRFPLMRMLPRSQSTLIFRLAVLRDLMS